MIKFLNSLALLAGLLLAGPAFGAEYVVLPGAWEMRSTTHMLDQHGNPSQAMSDTTHPVCLTEAYLAQEPYSRPDVDIRQRQKEAQCSSSNEEQQPSSASWNMVCLMKDGTRYEMSVQNTLSRDSLLLKTYATGTSPGSKETVRILMQQAAKRIGECKPGMSTL